MVRGFRNSVVSVLTLSASLVSAAHAQEAGEAERAAPVEEAGQRGQLDEIVVTAQKRAQKLQDVPLAISALDEGALERKGITNLTDAASSVPGLAVTNDGPGSTRVSLRGLSSTGANYRQGATIGYYLDEIPVTLANNVFIAQIDPDLFDLARIEVLRGPQGTLYGSGSIGGTIRYLFNEPSTSRLEARVKATVGTVTHGGENWGLNALANIPVLDDAIAVRVSGYARRDAGFIDLHLRDGSVDKDVNDADTRGGRISVLLKPTESIEILPIFYYNKTKFGSNSDYDSSFPGFEAHRDIPSNGSDEYKLYGLTARFDFDWAALTSVTSYYDRTYSRREDYAQLITRVLRTSFPPSGRFLEGVSYFDGTSRQFSQEVRLASQGSGPLTWLTGVYYSKARNTQFQVTDSRGFGAMTGGTFRGFDVSNDNLFTGLTVVRDQQAAIFGEFTYNITDSLAATVGGRAFHATQRTNRDLNGLLQGGTVIFELGTEASGFVPKFLLSFKPDRDRMFYLSATKGFRNGGTNSPVPATCAGDLAALGLTEPPQDFSSDTVWSYEAGAKTDWFDRKLRVNVAAYQINWSSVQQGAILPSCGFSFTGNGGKARSRGVELEATIVPAAGLELSANYGYIDATLQLNAPGLGAFRGDELLEVPTHSGNFSAQYTYELASGLETYLRADYSFRTKVRQSYNRTVSAEFRPGYETVNARFGIKSGSWEASLFAQNLFDERGYTFIETASQVAVDGQNPRKAISIRPRTIGISVNTNF